MFKIPKDPELPSWVLLLLRLGTLLVVAIGAAVVYRCSSG